MSGVAVVCVKWGSEFGPEYVNILFDSVWRNLSKRTGFRFFCLTDDKSGLNPGIETRELDPGHNGWWNKLQLFKFDASEFEQVFYFDLDTLITGGLDNLFSYRGPFAMLSDFYRPDDAASGVMSWPAGWGNHVWECFESFRPPDNYPGGDGAFLDLLHPDAERLQRIFTKTFASYKGNGLQQGGPKRGVSVVCFHGLPRPHQATDDWVKGVWAIGGWQSAEIETYCNTKDEGLRANILAATSRGLLEIGEMPEHGGHAVIVGGGPSLADSLGEIKRRYADGQDIFALNNAARYLVRHDIRPKYQVIMDARPENAIFVEGTLAEELLLASQVDPEVFRAANGTPVKLWHVNIPGAREILADGTLIGGGTTVLTRAMCLARAMGYRKIHLYGVDSSFDGAHHAYPQNSNDKDATVTAIVSGQKFLAATWMVAQVNEFQTISHSLAEDGCVITVHGKGLLPTVAREMMIQRGD